MLEGRRQEDFVCACVRLFQLPSHHNLPVGTGTAAATTEFSQGFLSKDSLWL